MKLLANETPQLGSTTSFASAILISTRVNQSQLARENLTTW